MLDTTVTAFRNRFARSAAAVVNLYGPTETTMVKSWYPVPVQGLRAGVQPIGTTQPDTQIVVVGPGNRICRPGERGEIVIRSPYRGLGYLDGAPRGYTVNPLRDDPDDLLYRTGDIGEVAADGAILPLGRYDGTVKIRGVRVHPADVAACATTHADVDACHVEPVGQDGERHLVAFVVDGGRQLDTDALRRHLQERLPASAVPQLLLFVDSLPLLPNGKVDRARLVDGEPDAAGDRPLVPPRTATEKAVLAVWADL